MDVADITRCLSEAVRTLFGASRTGKSVSNDADQFRKYLARFGTEFSRIQQGIQLTVADLGDVLEKLTLSQPRANTEFE